MPLKKLCWLIAWGVVLLLSGVANSKSVWRKADAGYQGQINGVAMSPNGRHIVLSGGFSRHSSDGGVSWETVSSSPEIMVFGDNTRLFGVASSQDCNQSGAIAGLFRSTDYGKTWLGTPVATPMCLNDVFFLDSLHGWAVGSNNDSIVITKNGGRMIFMRTLGFTYDFLGLSRFAGGGVSFLDSLNGFVAGWLVGTDSAILRTRDGGNTWNVLPIGIFSFAGLSVKFVDTLNGWLMGASNDSARGIYRTRDGGHTWTEQGPFSGTMEGIQAVDSLHAWVISGDAAGIWKTSDGGEHWNLEYGGPGGYLLDLAMVDSAHGVAAGDLGTVLIYAPLILGDLNADEQVTAADVVYELLKVFLNEPFPSPSQAGDLNCDGSFTPADVVLLLMNVFYQSPFPCSV